MPLVSIIIPIYNTEKYLSKCLDSVLSQTLKNIEVLLINDGSTDGSQKICEEYACKDKRIQVLHTTNQGVSHARNLGLEMAKGEYISFIDSDDWIDTDMIATLYQLINTQHTDLSSCGYIIESESGNIIYKINEKSTYILDKWEAITSLFHDSHYRYKGNIWDKLFKKEIIERNMLRFNESIYYNEDRLFTFQYLHLCQSTTYTCSSYYHYITRKSSAMSSYQKTYNEKMCTFMDAFDIMTSMSGTCPRTICQIMSIDYIKSSIQFFIKYKQYISFSNIKKRTDIIIKRNYPFLSLQQKIKYTLYYANGLIRYFIQHLYMKGKNYFNK